MKDQETNEQGILDLGERTYGTYYLVEEKAPANYIKSDKPIKIVLSASPSYNQDGSTLSITGKGIIELKDEQTVIGYQFTVTNNSGYELPSTGGPGTSFFGVM